MGTARGDLDRNTRRRSAQLTYPQADLPDDSVLAGRTTLPQLAALVAEASLVVCGGTGIAHLATAVGTPSVVLFGPVPPEHWGPPPSAVRTRTVQLSRLLSAIRFEWR